MWDKIVGVLGGDTIKAVGSGIGNVLDRFVPKKMAESEKWEKMAQMTELNLKSDAMNADEIKSAREMYMTELKTQPQLWIVRLMNGVFRPFAGFVALGYLTDAYWGQILARSIEGFVWVPIVKDPAIVWIMGGIIGFFFGFRQLSKNNRTTNVS